MWNLKNFSYIFHVCSNPNSNFNIFCITNSSKKNFQFQANKTSALGKLSVKWSRAGTKIIFLLQFLNWKFHYNWKLQVRSGFYIELENIDSQIMVLLLSLVIEVFWGEFSFQFMLNWSWWGRRCFEKVENIITRAIWNEFKTGKMMNMGVSRINREVKIPSIFNPLSS